MNGKRTKGTIAFLLTVLMLLSVLPAAVYPAFAETETTPVDITLAYQDATGAFRIPNRALELEPGLAESYGYTIGAEIEPGAVTALDAIVAAHIEVFGSEKSVINEKLSVGANGFADNFMGDGAGNMYYYVNGASPWVSAGETVLNAGDAVRLHAVRDTTAWSDAYTWFESGGAKVEKMSVTAGKAITLTVMKNAYDENWNTIEVAAEDAKIVPVEIDAATGVGTFGTQLAITNSEGEATVTFSTPGTYIISAVENDSTKPLISPWLEVTVIEGESGTDAPVGITLAYQDATGAFKIPNRALEVEPGLAESYGYTIGAEIESGAVTALDAIVAAHIEVFGSEKSVINEKLLVGVSGFLSSFMGDGAGNMYYFVNDVSPLVSAGETVLNNGDRVRLHAVRDTTAWSDAYTWFESGGAKVEKISVVAGKAITLTLMKNEYDVEWNIVEVAADNAKIVTVEIDTTTGVGAFGTQLALTNSEGVAAVTFSAPGTYIISAQESDPAKPLISPWLEVTVTAGGTEIEGEITEHMNKVSAYLLSAYPNPGIDYEWNIIGLARGGYLTDAYKDLYVNSLKTYIQEKDGNLDTTSTNTKRTEFSRVALALTAIGEDPTSFAGYNLLQALAEFDNVNKQGVNSTAYALIALDSVNYTIPAPTANYSGEVTTREKLINRLVSTQQSGGGWSIDGSSENTADIDVTAMIVQALAPYSSLSDIKATIDKAINWLGERYQNGFTSCETYAQTIVTLNALGIELSDPRFVNSSNETLYDGMMTYNIESSGAFKNILEGNANMLATAQGMYGLVSMYRTQIGANRLYDMTDGSGEPQPIPGDKAALNAKIAQAESITQGNYTTASWNVMKSALAAAKAVAADTQASQSTIDAALQALETAIAGLTTSGGGGPVQPSTMTVTFSLYGALQHDGAAKYIYRTNSGIFEKWLVNKSYTFDGTAETVYDVFTRAVNELGYDVEYANQGTYVASIKGPEGWLGEFDNGSNSGWMFSVNGVYSSAGLRDVTVKNGDVIIWHYTDDHTKEESSSGGTGTGGIGGSYGGSIGTSVTTGSSGNSAAGADVNVVINASTVVSGGKATTSVTDSQFSDALNRTLNSLKGKDESAIGEVRIKVDNRTASTAAMTLTGKSIKAANANENIVLTFDTGIAAVTFDNAALKKLSSEVVGDDARVEMTISKAVSEAVSESNREILGDNPAFELKLTVGGDAVTDFGTGKVIAVLPYTVKTGENSNELTVCHLAENGIVKEMKGAKYDANLKAFVFTTNHFSIFFIAPKSLIWENPFTDVSVDDWFYEAVEYTQKNGLMNGVEAEKYSPNESLTRAMLVTILYRIAGEPAVTGENPFTDVAEGQWYTEAIIWATANEVVTGYGEGRFGATDNITREQFAVVLYRYAQMKGYETTKTTSLTKYSDESEVSEWARSAMSWSNAVGLINGRTETLIVPSGTATRAEAATILMRFIENVTK